MAKLEIGSGRARGAESVSKAQDIDLTGLSVETDVALGIGGMNREKYVKPRRSRKAPGIKAAVIQQRLENKSKRQISQDLGITRNTVTTILEESNVEQALKNFQQQSVELVPEALRVMRVRLQANSENAAIKTLESTIWPLADKRGKGTGDQGIVLAIQNLMGNVQVNENKAVEPVSASSPSTIAVPDNGAVGAQVIDNKGQTG